jgi:hypothetical protein
MNGHSTKDIGTEFQMTQEVWLWQEMKEWLKELFVVVVGFCFILFCYGRTVQMPLGRNLQRESTTEQVPDGIWGAWDAESVEKLVIGRMRDLSDEKNEK